MFEHVQPVIADYENRPAACREYDPRAAAVARSVASLVTDQLPELCVEHIGSSAVPGCAGTGIVDLMIPVSDGESEAVKTLLGRLGFQQTANSGSFFGKHLLCVGALEHDGQTFLLHVHVVAADSPQVEEMRFFRACLRADPTLRKLYVARKRQIISSGVTNRPDYCSAKGEFIQKVLG